MRAIAIAAITEDKGQMEQAILDLLSVPSRTLRRIRGGKNIQKTYDLLARQLKSAAFNDLTHEMKVSQDMKAQNVDIKAQNNGMGDKTNDREMKTKTFEEFKKRRRWYTRDMWD